MDQDPLAKGLSGLLILAVIVVLYFGASLWIPVTFALLLALQLDPAVTLLQRCYIPRPVSAALLLLAIGGPFTLLGIQLVEPAQKWVERVPEVTAKLNQQLVNITEVVSPVDDLPSTDLAVPEPEKENGFRNFFGWFDGDDAETSTSPPDTAKKTRSEEQRSAVSDRLLLGGLDIFMQVLARTPLFLAQCLGCIILVVFLLVHGPLVYRTAIDVFPWFKDKDATAKLVKDTQRELSRYILYVSLINGGLGLITSIFLWLLGFEDPLLWGSMVALANFAPYVGTIFSLSVLALAGLAQFGLIWGALLPALVFFIVNAIESQLVTPAVLGRNMRINPLVIMLWLMLWAGLWGIAGVLIAVPLLVCVKLILSQSPRFDPWIKLIESRGSVS